MFTRNLNCKKETVSSIFQAYGAQDYSNAIKHDQELDNAIVTFNQMEKHAEQQSFRTYKVDDVDEKELTEEMKQAKEQEMKELKMREQLCRDSPELTELNDKLHQACMRKDMELQMEEKEHEKQEQKIIDRYYQEQMYSATQRQMLEAESKEQALQRQKVEYRKALEQQMQEELDKKKELKYRQYQEEQRVTQGEIDRMTKQDEKYREEKQNKMMKLRQDMEESLKSREQMRQHEKLQNQELEKKVESYWEQSSRHEVEMKHGREEKQKLITQRQEQCAQSLQEINQRKQTRADLMENITVMSQLTSQDNNDKQHDVDEIDKRLRQTQLCSELDGQVADKVRAKQRAKQVSGDFHETWIWGSDPTRQQDEKLRKQREVADYNRATVVEHEAQRRAQRHCNDMQDNADEIAEQVLEEERERLLEAQENLVH
ncbi:hypothetical protein M8J76_003166 [Diaphorina citri]|nr:hypothetical protein M8J75_016585 [Diaphorina citri]KAI5723229.1 hypothetical protein M8J76_003166 [Diaphorina citri]